MLSSHELAIDQFTVSPMRLTLFTKRSHLSYRKVNFSCHKFFDKEIGLITEIYSRDTYSDQAVTITNLQL